MHMQTKWRNFEVTTGISPAGPKIAAKVSINFVDLLLIVTFEIICKISQFWVLRHLHFIKISVLQHRN